ncbi:chromosome segregation ATPase [Sedimentibacter acidaminivorans]|uniref:Chromosome segregation ATPase n=1 Tax=Sedimentibacter acidaminivorans TaxID=913099 RepID=A0ABS4GA05_9FIRM|nr:AAA family ATPase [Sedimentibacter acidaminivorans]MBP1924521.1 chromosome segregation ATPase [Sedimentibacter acidaminivorans]
MYINKLYLRAFGKFVYKRIYLGKKLNIIYGENETGKSTIHSFIESVLYGFDDANGLDLYKKYKPWDSNLYKGSITIDGFNNNKYLVTKDFLLGTTKIFNKEFDDSDVSDNLDNPISDAENSDCPGAYFFNMNKTSYRNTVSIKQLGNKTDKELSVEVTNKIINLSKSKDESISIERILASLNRIKEEAGSEDNPKTLLGQYAIRLKDLNNTKEIIINRNRQVMFLSMEKKKLMGKIQEIGMHINDLNKDLLTCELLIEKDKYTKSVPIKAELDEINQELSQYKNDILKEYSDIDFDDISKLNIELDLMRSKRHELRVQKEELDEKLKNLREDVSNRIKNDFDIDKMNDNFINYQKNNNKITELRNKILLGTESLKGYDFNEINKFIEHYEVVEENNNKIDMIKLLLSDKNYDLMMKFIKSQNLKGFMFVLLGTLFLLAAGYSGYMVYYFNAVEYYGGLSTILLGIISYIMAIKSGRRVSSARKEIESIECQHLDYNKIVKELENENDEIFKETGCTNIEEFKSTYEKKEKEQNIITEKTKLINFDKESLDKLVIINSNLEKNMLNDLAIFDILEISSESVEKANEIYNRKDLVQEEILKTQNLADEKNQVLNIMDKEISFEEKRFSVILNSNKMSSFDEFKEIVSQNEKIMDLKTKKVYCENLLSTLLGKRSLEELRIKTKDLQNFDAKEIDEKEYQIKIFKLNEERNQVQININNIDKEIDEIENTIRNLAEVEEEIEFYEDKISFFKEKIQVAKIASEKIIEISDSIKGDFMPLLKKSISENFAYVTGGKYKEVAIDEDMNISIVSEDNNNRNISIDSLSGGTIDQLYLSLRISLSNILSGNQNIPIILDDSFVQYDSNRLKKSIEMLAKESERRQVILFTCQEREVEIAKSMNLKFNLIKL